MRRHLRGLIIGLAVGAAVVALILGLFILSFGWGRFVSDFWPLDRSFIGPNLCASFAIVVGITARNEARAVERDEDQHRRLSETIHDAVHEAVHPTESAEEHIAADVKETP